MMILLTDGQGYYNNYYTQQAVNNNITIYTIGLGSGVNSGLLTGIATATGGQYYSVSTADQLPQVFRAISSEIEPTDTDGDGIPDITETDGLIDGFELEIGTDPLIKDTDYDDFDDREEYLDPDHDPLVYEKRYSYLEIGRELVLGAILGKWSTDDHDSVYYLSGLILSGFMVYGDIRDIAESIWRKDGLGGLLNAIGLIPALGDLTKNYIITCYIRYN
jgi:hypothetical protein